MIEKEYLEELLKEIDTPVGNEAFYQKFFSCLTRKSPQEKDPITRLCSKQYDKLSQNLDDSQVQDSCSVRNNLRTRSLATLLISDSGGILLPSLKNAIKNLSLHLYSMGPNRQHDITRQEHLLNALQRLLKDKPLQVLIKSLTKPHANPFADQIIRKTLQLDSKVSINDAHVRRAALSAWFSLLRQNVGSCFATAPAILVQAEQPETFFTDLRDLLNRSRLYRTFGGTEYSVPLSQTFGVGDLRKMIIIPPESDGGSIAKSPGLLLALEKIEILDKDKPLSKRISDTKELLCRLLNTKKASERAIVTDIEKILRLALLEKLDLSEEDLQEEAMRSTALVNPQSLFNIEQRSPKKSKKALCKSFYEQLEKASTAFLSLTENPLLKSWEFTIASFAEVKPSLSRYNFYASLGLEQQHHGGIGEQLYTILSEKIQETNALTQEYQEQYEQLYLQVQHTRSRMQNPSSGQDSEWIQSQYRQRLGDLQRCEAMRNETHQRAQKLAGLYNILLDIYDKKFVEYFQEVYDADIHEVNVGPYDDSPAGFRLLYKGGRSNVSQWERITNPTEFSDSLSRFFVATEQEVISLELLQGVDKEVSTIITALVSHVKTEEFLESALHRMAITYNAPIVKDPLKNLDKVKKKPWVYTSGGTMGPLVSCYFSREEKPSEVERWVENEQELLAFFIDTIKMMPEKTKDLFIENPNKSVIVHSPTHAFLLKPGFPLFKEAWTSKEYTYTWIQEKMIKPRERFVDSLILEGSMVDTLLERIKNLFPKQFHHFFHRCFRNPPRRLLSTEFRRYVTDGINYDKNLRWQNQKVVHNDDIDALLYSSLPIILDYELERVVKEIFQETKIFQKEEIEHLIQTARTILYTLGRSNLYTANEVRSFCLSVLMAENCCVSSSKNLPSFIIQAMQNLGYMMPAPLTFADSNWIKDFFAFVVSPGTGQLEFWRIDKTSTEGQPVSPWKMWLDGTKKSPTWGVYHNPFEYQ